MLLPLLLAGQVPTPVHTTCPPEGAAAVLVDIAGFRNRAGQVRVRVFGGAPKTWFDKRHWLARIEVPVPATGRITYCMPVPRPGVYAVDVRHDTNGNGKTDRSDGGGASGNPKIGLFDMLLARKPDPQKVQVRVGAGVTTVPITLMYLQGGTFRPVR